MVCSKVRGLPLSSVWLFGLVFSCLGANGGLFAAIDQNLDGVVDVVDAQMVANFATFQDIPSFPGHGDPNGDNQIDVLDVQLTVMVVLGQPLPLTICTPSNLRPRHSGLYMQQKLQAFGGTGQLAWGYSGVLPPGLVMSSDGMISGLPTLQGIYTFTAMVADSTGARLSRSFTLPINVGNQAPVALGDSYVVPSGTPLIVPAPGILGNDNDPDWDPLTISIVTAPTVGTLVMNQNGGFTFTAGPNAPMVLVFRYRITDTLGLFAEADVLLGNGNLPPTANPDAYTVVAGNTLTVQAPGVLANDTDPDNNPLTSSVAVPPRNGTLVLAANGGFTYNAVAGFTGVDSFEYMIDDGFGGLASTVCFVTVTSPSAPWSFGISVRVSPEVVESGTPVTITAIITHYPGATATQAMITGVAFPGTLFGPGASTRSLVQGSLIGPFTTIWTATATPVAASGLHEFIVTADGLPGQSGTGNAAMVVYTGAPIRVGLGRPLSTVQAGINACPIGGAVLIDPGVYTGAGNTGLTVTTAMTVAGSLGALVTRIDCAGVGRAFENPGPTAATVIACLTVSNGGDSGMTINSSPTLYDLWFLTCFSPTNGGAIRMTGGAPTLVACRFANNVAGVINAGGNRYGGAVHAFSSTMTLRRCSFTGNQVHASYESGGGGLSIDGGTCSLLDCLFTGNTADSGYASQGGALRVRLGALNATHCVVKGNIARSVSVGVVVGSTSSSSTYDGYEGQGGAVASLSGLVEMMNCDLSNNQCSGNNEGEGGAVYVSSNNGPTSLAGCVVLDQCRVSFNTSTGVYSGDGGAFHTDMKGNVRCDHCIIQGNAASGGYEAEGGVVYSGTVWSAWTAPWNIGFHNCLIIDNSVTAPVMNRARGNVMYINDWFPGSGTPTIAFENCTITGNTGGAYCMFIEKGNATFTNTIMFQNAGSSIHKLGAGVVTLVTSNIMPLPTVGVGPIPLAIQSVDPNFVSLAGGPGYFLAQAPLQASTSVCVNAGTPGPSAATLALFSTATDYSPDTGVIDLGYHRIPPTLPLIPRAGQTAAALRAAFP